MKSTTNSSCEATSKMRKPAMGPNANREDEGYVGKVNLGYLTAFVDMLQSKIFQEALDYTKMTMVDCSKWSVNEFEKINELKGEKWLITLRDLTRDKLNKAKKSETKMADTRMNNEKTETPVTELSLLVTRHICQIFRVSLAIHTYGVMDRRIIQLFTENFVENSISQRFVIGSAFFTNILEQSKGSRTYSKASKLNIDIPSNLEAILFFHAIRIIRKLKEGFKLSHNTGTRIGFAIQTLCKC